MAAVLYLLVFLFAGAWLARLMLPRMQAAYRLWVGAASGLMLLMWLPALAAFAMPFGVYSHMAALGGLLIVLAAGFLFRDKSAAKPWGKEDGAAMKALLWALPLVLLCGYLLHTHYLRPVDGALHVGQATYGDLPLHLGIASSMRGSTLPMEYSIFPGARLAYPFLADTLASSMMVLGLSLRAAFVLTGVLMCALVIGGYLLLALRMADGKKAAVLALFLVFINGGLGFLYALDMAGVPLGQPGSRQLQMGTWFERVRNMVEGWYQTPANHAEFGTYNLRWSNIIADMLIPQRTFLAGWAVLMPCLYLLWDGLHLETRGARQFVYLGVMAGLMPLVHTHSFLALALVSFGWLLYDGRRFRGLHWLWYVLATGLLALPQLVFFTFGQASSGGHFLAFRFNWVNGGDGLKDEYFWFYLKNIGLPFLLLVFSLFEKNKNHRFIFLGAFMVFAPAEFIRFQPNEYDNNKLLYVWWALCAVPAAEYAALLWRRLRGLRARPLMAALACLALFFSGGVALVREAKSDYEMFSAGDARAAEWVEKNTPEHALFMSGTRHINPVSALAGRRIVCGPGLWLYYHGFDISEREKDIQSFYMSPAEREDVLQKYGAGYIYLSGSERAAYDAKEEALDALYPRLYTDEAQGIVIYEAKKK